jgi:hypothetical protein
MLKRIGVVLAAVAAVAVAIPTIAQNMRLPQMRGVWNPAVGAGALYERTDSDKSKRQFTAEIIGKESVNGATGYWMEYGFDDRGQQNWAQMLLVVNGAVMHAEKVIFELPGRGAFIFPAAIMAGRGMDTNPKSTIADDAKKVGSESVVTPAGTFDCDHWKGNDGKWDAWISPKVQPWGLVKLTESDGTSTIVVKTISDAKSHITGTPQVFDPSMFGRRGQ